MALRSPHIHRIMYLMKYWYNGIQYVNNMNPIPQCTNITGKMQGVYSAGPTGTHYIWTSQQSQICKLKISLKYD